MNNVLKHSWSPRLFAFLLLVLAGACKPQYDYTIKGKVVKATTGEPLEGVVVEVYREICQGTLFNGGCGPDPDEYYSTITNANGEFAMAITSEQNALELNFKKQFMYRFSSGGTRGTNRLVYPGSSTLNLSMVAQTEWFTIEFEPKLPNVKEVTLGLEWNRFSGGSAENVIWGTFPPYFTIFDNPRRPTSLGYYGEQWLKMNFDILFEDGSQLQKTDSIWLPGRYYDFEDFEWEDPRRFPVYKFEY